MVPGYSIAVTLSLKINFVDPIQSSKIPLSHGFSIILSLSLSPD